ncbi:MAG: histidine kinase [Bacillota bacterium]
MNNRFREEIKNIFDLEIIDEQDFPWGCSYSLQLEPNGNNEKKYLTTSRTVSIVIVKPHVIHQPHIHFGYDEILYGLEGQTIHWSNNGQKILEKGKLVFIPSGGEHKMVNNTNEHAKFLSIVYPTIPDSIDNFDMVDDVELLEFLKITNLDTIAGVLAKNVNLSVTLVDISGVLLSELNGFPAFCKLCLGEKIGNCIIALHNDNKLEKNKNVYRCKFNVYSVQSPIKINGRLLGYLGCGYGRGTLPSSQEVDLIRESFSKENKNSALQEFFNLAFINRNHLKSTGEILSLVSASLVRLIIQSAREKQLNMYKLTLSNEKQRQAQLENTLNEAKLKFLEAQVNPHFLFNTLNTIAQAATIEGAATAASLTYALASLLRCSLGKSDYLVTIKEELTYIKDYLLIQKTRFPSRFEVEKEITEKAMDVKIPFMTIMTLVENSIIHGFTNIRWQGKLKIKGKVEGNTAIIEVIDNGVGMSDEVIQEVKSFREDSTLKPSSLKGIGLKNIYKRLEYYYADKFEFIIKVLPNKGTQVTIKIFLS